MAQNYQLTIAEEKLAQLLWLHAPITSPELVELAQAELEWKKSTTYTVLKKLCNKGVFQNEHANISVLLSCDELKALQSRHYVEDSFGGSLPKFITAFIGDKRLTPEQAAEIKQLIDAYESGERDE